MAYLIRRIPLGGVKLVDCDLSKETGKSVKDKYDSVFYDILLSGRSSRVIKIKRNSREIAGLRCLLKITNRIP